jgi:FkbM family methyltransferase
MLSVMGGIEYSSLVQKWQTPAENKVSLKILDIGANIGLFTLFVSDIYPLSQSVLVEPDHENVSLLKKNISNHKIIEAALYLKDGFVSFDSNLPHNAKKIASDGATLVKAVSLKTVFSESNFENVDILKMDIEGGEWALLIPENIPYFQKARLLIVEYHLGKNDTLLSKVDLIAYFTSMGFTFLEDVPKETNGLIYLKKNETSN